MAMIRKLLLKRKARKLYEKYNDILNYYGCGRHLAHEITPQLNKIMVEFNKTMDKLAEIDPDCPKTRIVIR